MAAPSGRQPTTSIFIGNVGFTAVEDELAAVFKQAGPLKSFRLVTDRETGKVKGYAFAEYFDLPTASSAQRNLNGVEYHGRPLRVDFADNEKHGSEHFHKRERERDRDEPRRPTTVGREAVAAAGQRMAAALGGPGGSGQQQISDALAKMTRGQLFEIMAQMKGLIQQNPTQARQILVQNPQLTKALFQAQILLGMVSPAPAPANGAAAPVDAAQAPLQAGVLQGGPQGLVPGQQLPPGAQAGLPFPQPGFPAPQPGLPAQQLPGQVPVGVPGAGPLPAPPMMQGAQPLMQAGPADPRQRPPVDPRQQAAPVDPRLQAAQQAPVDPRQMQQPAVSQPPLDPRQQQPAPGMPGYQQPLPAAPVDPRQQQMQQQQQQQAPPPPALQQIPEEQQALLRQVMSLTPQQIDLLPEAQKQQVLDVQRQLRAAGMLT